MQSTSSTEVMKIRHFLRATKHRYFTEHLKMASAKLPQDKFLIKTKYIKCCNSERNNHNTFHSLNDNISNPNIQEKEL